MDIESEIAQMRAATKQAMEDADGLGPVMSAHMTGIWDALERLAAEVARLERP